MSAWDSAAGPGPATVGTSGRCCARATRGTSAPSSGGRSIRRDGWRCWSAPESTACLRTSRPVFGRSWNRRAGPPEPERLGSDLLDPAVTIGTADAACVAASAALDVVEEDHRCDLVDLHEMGRARLDADQQNARVVRTAVAVAALVREPDL